MRAVSHRESDAILGAMRQRRNRAATAATLGRLALVYEVSVLGSDISLTPGRSLSSSASAAARAYG